MIIPYLAALGRPLSERFEHPISTPESDISPQLPPADSQGQHIGDVHVSKRSPLGFTESLYTAANSATGADTDVIFRHAAGTSWPENESVSITMTV